MVSKTDKKFTIIFSMSVSDIKTWLKITLGQIINSLSEKLSREKTWREKKFTTLKDEISNKTRE
jgi:hypothetical protein